MNATNEAFRCPYAEEHPAIEARLKRLETDVDDLQDRQRTQGESIATLRAQVAMSAGLGSLIGGGIVAMVVKLITR